MKGKLGCWILLGATVGAALSLPGCGGGSAAPAPQPPSSLPTIAVNVSPPSPTVSQGAMQAFTASVTGTANTAVTWSVQEGAPGGAITNAGVYTAPASLGTFRVIATSAADAGATGIATVTVVHSSFVPTGTMETPRVNHTATLLDNGKVLVTGGSGASTELFDPVTGSFSPTGDMRAVRASHTAALLLDGRVLISGGITPAADGDVCATLNSAELFDPATGTFSPTGNMTDFRFGHTASTLKNGKVLIAGGTEVFEDSDNLCTKSSVHASAELYDPATGSFTPTGNMNSSRWDATATLLSDGRVLIAGGFTDGGFGDLLSLWTAEIYDPTTGTFALTGPMSNPRAEQTAALLQNGHVLIAGGVDDEPSLPQEVFAAAELYDPTTGRFTTSAQTAAMRAPRWGHTATRLPSGDVLIAGGDNSSGVLSTAELFNSVTGVFSPTVSMSAKRFWHTATLLQNGLVLITGGSSGSGIVLASAELYQQ